MTLPIGMPVTSANSRYERPSNSRDQRDVNGLTQQRLRIRLRRDVVSLLVEWVGDRVDRVAVPAVTGAPARFDRGVAVHIGREAV